jgi:hypothetical protein
LLVEPVNSLFGLCEIAVIEPAGIGHDLGHYRTGRPVRWLGTVK